MKKYTERLRSLREDADLTQSAVAELLNVGQKTYSDYELGKTRIPLESVIILAKYYNVSMDYICGVSNLKNEFPQNSLS
ncbi:MAG: helix-turn-helix transcriptional regulator [Oscillospiraceae bacterium]|nr:helix-turn-helix transcriptional regulator [Oscillospiraceae bacterium]